jgi:hypothetical protein
VFDTVEAAARQAGFSDERDSWGDDVRLLRL